MLDQITLIYCLCDDLLKASRHREHSLCRMTDAEVMTCALTAARFFGGRIEHARRYLAEHGLIPRMLSKSQLGRRLHRLTGAFGHLFDALAATFKQTTEQPVFALDTMPVPAMDNARIPRARLYRDEAFRAFQAAKHRYYYGLKLHLVVDAHARPVECMLTPGSVADVRGLYGLPLDLPDGSTLVGDKAYNDRHAEALLGEVGVALLPLRKSNMAQHEPGLTRWLFRQRKVVETAASGIARLMPRSIAAVTAAGFELRAFLFVLAYAIACL
jgi:hypothetical protein